MPRLAGLHRPQPAILAPVAAVGLGLAFDLVRGVDPRPGLGALRGEPDDGAVAIGIGAPLAQALGAPIDGLHGFAGVSGVGVGFPSTQGALWIFVRGEERGAVLDRARAITRALGEGWVLREEVDTFRYREGRDLTGYVDGTENPAGEAAKEAALIGAGTRGGDGRSGASFVAVQRFVHDLARFEAFDGAARDAMVGRRADTNEEIEDAVATAHVKRTAQESFDPPAFMVRRSMPWGGLRESGLYFVAYVASLDRFGRMLDRMAGLEDGAVDGLLNVTRAVSGGYYFCPPMQGGALDLRALGL
jgi:putative iron-dependent peroxidase